jgi:hypothetical protein
LIERLVVNKKLLMAIAVLATAVFCSVILLKDKSPNTSKAPPTPVPDSAVDARMHKSCSRCHKFPEPVLLPKSLWRDTIFKMYDYVGMKGKALDGFSAQQVIAWYEARAPETVPFRKTPAEANSLIIFKKFSIAPPGPPPSPAVAGVKLWDRRDGRGQDVILADMRHKFILKADLSGGFERARFSSIARLPHPCRMDICDFDGDGTRDILVANLGSFNPGDHKKGSVALIRNVDGGQARRANFLVKGLGRVADARAADLDGDGDQDVLVGVFGWHDTGQVLWLENRTRDWQRPSFVKHPIDGRHGVINTPILDFNNDGRPDFLAQFAQEYEMVVCFANKGRGFEAQIIDQAPHPAWGSNGMELMDLDGDGDQDILLSNGDTLDSMFLRPSHGLRWLENQGPGQWKNHELAPMYAVSGARAGDIDGDGDLDVVASAFLPQFNPNDELKGTGLPSLMWFEQTSPKTFKPWVIERLKAFHPTLELGDIDADGDIDIVVGNFTMRIGDWDKLPYWLQIWENPGRKN